MYPTKIHDTNCKFKIFILYRLTYKILKNCPLTYSTVIVEKHRKFYNRVTIFRTVETQK